SSPSSVAPAEPATTGDAQSVDDPPSARFTWTIDNFSRLNTKKLYSDVFVVGGYRWRILIFPKGNNVDHLSMYLDVADSGTLPYGWSRYAQFSLTVVNQLQQKCSIRKGSCSSFRGVRDHALSRILVVLVLELCSRSLFLGDNICLVMWYARQLISEIALVDEFVY
ncbi:unnamed protein product, partial [Linum tenue]